MSYFADVPVLTRRHRVYALHEFVVKTYGHLFQKGSVVLDVAGGKGDLSWLLLNVDQFDAVVVDPRITDHSAIEKSVAYLRNHPEAVSERKVPGLSTFQPLCAILDRVSAVTQVPRHLRIHLDDAFVQACPCNDVSNRICRDELDNGTMQGMEETWSNFWLAATQRAQNENVEPPGHHQPPGFGSEVGLVRDAADALQLIRNTSLILGFHPDQATEPIIDLALKMKVPFLVCPCCIFPAEFPERRTPDGRTIKEFTDFIDYLSLKHPNIRLGRLPFRSKGNAKNIILYTLPGDYG